MSPDQIDTVTNGLIELHAMADVYGPGLLLAAAAVAGWRACQWIAGLGFRLYGTARGRRGIRQLEAFANHPANRPRREKP